MDEQSDTVRIMSIHKSKGLEFPVVFAGGMGKRFNMQDTKGSVLLHPEWGVGLDDIDLERRTKKTGISEENDPGRVHAGDTGRRDEDPLCGTDPREGKTHYTGCTDIAALSDAAGSAGVFRVEGARCCLDWILPVVLEACGRQSGGRAEEKGIKEREGAPAELRVIQGQIWRLKRRRSRERTDRIGMCWNTGIRTVSMRRN